jgi:hypothetical protein
MVDFKRQVERSHEEYKFACQKQLGIVRRPQQA